MFRWTSSKKLMDVDEREKSFLISEPDRVVFMSYLSSMVVYKHAESDVTGQ